MEWVAHPFCWDGGMYFACCACNWGSTTAFALVGTADKEKELVVLVFWCCIAVERDMNHSLIIYFCRGDVGALY